MNEKGRASCPVSSLLHGLGIGLNGITTESVLSGIHMTLMVITTNSFLELAFHALHEEAGHDEPLCIIDVSSFRSLGQMLNEIQKVQLSSACTVLLLGGNNICSKVLLPLPVCPRDTPVAVLREKMHTGEHINAVLEKIYACRALDALSWRERGLARLLITKKTVRAVTRMTGWNEKRLQNRTGSAAKKLNLRSGKEFLLFLSREFQE